MDLFLGILLLLAIALLAIAAVMFVAIRMSHQEKRHGTSGALSGAMLEVQSLIDPAKKKVIEARQRETESEEDDESGDPPLK